MPISFDSMMEKPREKMQNEEQQIIFGLLLIGRVVVTLNKQRKGAK